MLKLSTKEVFKMKYRCCFKSPFGFVKIEGDFDKVTSIKLTELPKAIQLLFPTNLIDAEYSLKNILMGKENLSALSLA